MALIRTVLLLLFSMFLASRKAVLLLLFGMFLAFRKGRLVYSRLSVCVLEFNVTCNEISVIYVTAQMCRRTEEEVVPTCTVGLSAP